MILTHLRVHELIHPSNFLLESLPQHECVHTREDLFSAINFVSVGTDEWLHPIAF